MRDPGGPHPARPLSLTRYKLHIAGGAGNAASYSASLWLLEELLMIMGMGWDYNSQHPLPYVTVHLYSGDTYFPKHYRNSPNSEFQFEFFVVLIHVSACIALHL
ncbi:hypothetical protein GDO81_026927 [Engystomops pustulosus]|uniref:Uncharacterized protein n=1 Tax=Engystomops pustulosus TaxID=76066 RepID=A0AAV6YLV8_ENGPU|nr:hypothetical protein GDO81_026927 [Engystomops pustulosus]